MRFVPVGSLACLAMSPALAAQFVFAPPLLAGGEVGGLTIHSADLDLDGQPDVLVRSEAQLMARLGLGGGLFGADLPVAAPAGPALPVVVPAGSGPFNLLVLGMPLITPDLDGDGVPDLVHALTDSDPDLAFSLGQGDGTFLPQALWTGSVKLGTAALDAGDINLDGTLDLLFCSVVGGSYTAQQSIFLQEPSGDYVPYDPMLASGSVIMSARLLDADADGLLDLLANVRYHPSLAHPSSVELYGQTPFGSHVLLGTLPDALAVDVDLLDGDAVPDLLAWHPQGAATWRMTGDGRFELLDVVQQPAENATPVQVADLDGDGTLDVLVHAFSGVSWVYRGLGGGTFADEPVPFTWGVLSYSVLPAVVDVDADGRLDLVSSVGALPAAPRLSAALNATYAAGSPLLDLGGALAGAVGWPIVIGAGTFVGGTPVQFDVWGAPTAAPVLDVLGLSHLGAPFKGGVLVPQPDELLGPFAATPQGTLSLAGTWPAGLSSGLVLYQQFWFADAAGPAGFAATSGVQLTLP